MKILILLILFIGLSFGANVCNSISYKQDKFVEKQIKEYIKLNPKLTKQELINKGADECVANYNLPACAYTTRKVKIENERIDNFNIFDFMIVVNSYITSLLLNANGEYEEAIKLLAYEESKDLVELTDKIIKENKNLDEDIKKFLWFNKNGFPLSLQGCPLYLKSENKLVYKEASMPCACRLHIATLIKENLKENSHEILTQAKNLCDTYKDGKSCFLTSMYFIQGLGARQDIKQAKKYSGLACDYGEQVGCDMYKELK